MRRQSFRLPLVLFVLLAACSQNRDRSGSIEESKGHGSQHSATSVVMSGAEVNSLVSATNWKPIGPFMTFKPTKTAEGCQPVSYGCNSCCADGVSGNYFVRSDCSTGCAKGCGSEPCH